MDYYLIASTVPCPKCHVRAWQRCKTKGGFNSPGHVARYWLAIHPDHADEIGNIDFTGVIKF